MSKLDDLKQTIESATKGPFRMCTPCTRPEPNTCSIVWAGDRETTLLPFDDSCTDVKSGPERKMRAREERSGED